MSELKPCRFLDWLNRKRLNYLERRYYIKNKVCIECRYFHWFMGSAGICGANDGCPASRMRDCVDACNCGKFKKMKRNRRVGEGEKG